MTYDEFKTELCRRLRELLPSGTTLQLQKVYKNNGLKLDGLVISSSQSNISPTIFLNHYYEKRHYFPDIQAVCRDILLTYEHSRSPRNINVDFFTEYEQIKDHLAYRIINYEKNKELLQSVPHIRYLDLAVVFYCLLAVSENSNATILIHSKHLDLWHISDDELYRQTSRTTPDLLPYDFQNMSDVLASTFSGDQLRSSGTVQNAGFLCPMYVLTNSDKLYGASSMLYPNLLEDIADKLNADFFILPSSVHELVILPASSRSQWKALAHMVSDINRTELAADEFLSDHVYYYARAGQTLDICT